MSLICPAMGFVREINRDTVVAENSHGNGNGSHGGNGSDNGSDNDVGSEGGKAFATKDPERDQLYIWKNNHKGNKFVARDREGVAVPSWTNVQTLGPRGPPMIDTNFLRAMQSFNRKTLPVRLVHGKGIGAHGTFRVTHDITKYTKAKIFAPGKETQMFGRFSSNDFPGQPDTSNNQNHTAGLKFYTEDGNLDLLGFNLTVFDVRDPMFFVIDHTRSVHPNPQTAVTVDQNSLWDLVSLRPERLNMVVRANSDQGFPKTFRHMDIHLIAIFHFENDKGDLVYARLHFKTNQGLQSYTMKQSNKLGIKSPDIMGIDLYNAISKGNFPTYTLCCQIMTEEQRTVYESRSGLDVFDNTKDWPEKEFPLRPIGILTFNRLAENHFNETEQLAVDPGNLVPGIRIPPQERVLLGRAFSYNDAQVHRIGVNFTQLPINQPKGLVQPLKTYYRDGTMNSDTEQNGAPAYYPNSFGGPKIKPDYAMPDAPITGVIGRYDSSEDNTHYVQVIEYLNVTISPAERKRTADNLGDALRPAEPFIQKKILKMFREKVDEGFADLIEKRLNGGRNAEDDEDEEPVIPDAAVKDFVSFDWGNVEE